jgi:uncharacterized protein YkwD
MPDRDPDIRITIEHSIKVLGRWTAGLYLVIAVMLVAALIYASGQRARIERVTNDTVTALCTFRHDLQLRYDTGVKFLIDHPDGIPGIPAETLQQSLRNQKQTLESLRELPCPTKDEATEVLGVSKRPLRDGFIRAVNRARTDAGCRELKPTGKYLNRSAKRHSKAMANQDRLFHSTLRVGHWSKVGEVVGVGSSWQTIFFALMESKDHRRILLDCSYDRIAVGIIVRDRTWLTGRLYAK